MPIAGKLVLKGDKTKSKIHKKKKAKKASKFNNDIHKLSKEELKDKKINPLAVSIQSGKSYEEEFSIEMNKAKEGKPRSNPWRNSYTKPPKILHGYTMEIKGETAEERLDMRCSMKTDKFCK